MVLPLHLKYNLGASEFRFSFKMAHHIQSSRDAPLLIIDLVIFNSSSQQSLLLKQFMLSLVLTKMVSKSLLSFVKPYISFFLSV